MPRPPRKTPQDENPVERSHSRGDHPAYRVITDAELANELTIAANAHDHEAAGHEGGCTSQVQEGQERSRLRVEDFKKMRTIGTRLRFARERRGLTQSDLARRMTVAPQTVNQWESDTKTPGRKNLFKLVEILETRPMWFFYGEGPFDGSGKESISVTSPGGRMVPMRPLNSLVARVVQSSPDQPTLLTRSPCSDEAFATELPNDSNAPRYPKGACWVLDPKEEPRPGDMVIALYDTPCKPIMGELHFETLASGLVTIVTPLNPQWPAARSDLHAVEVMAVMIESTELRR